MTFESFYATRDSFHKVHEVVYSDATTWLSAFASEELQQYQEHCKYIEQSSPLAISVDAALTINRECLLLTSDGESRIFLDIGFIGLAQSVSRIMRYIISVVEDAEPDSVDGLISQLMGCSEAVGIALAVEAAYLQGDYDMSMMFLNAIEGGGALDPRWGRLFSAEPIDDGDTELLVWITRHILLHEFNHHLFEHSSAAKIQFERFASDALFRANGKLTKNASFYRKSLKNEIDQYKARGVRINERKRIRRIIKADLCFLDKAKHSAEDTVEIACDIQVINDHFSYLREQYPLQRWSADVLVHLLARPFLVQYILYCCCHIKHSASAAAANFSTFAESVDVKLDLIDRSLPLGLSRQAARPRILYDIVEVNIIRFQRDYGLPNNIVTLAMALCDRAKGLLDGVVADALLAQARFVPKAWEAGISGSLGDFEKSDPATLMPLIQLNLSPFAVPLQMQRLW